MNKQHDSRMAFLGAIRWNRKRKFLLGGAGLLIFLSVIVFASLALAAGSGSPPVIDSVSPSGVIGTNSPTIVVAYHDPDNDIDPSSVIVKLNGFKVSGCTATASQVSCPLSNLGTANYSITGSVGDLAGNSTNINGSFYVDTTKPTVNWVKPSGYIKSTGATISVSTYDFKGINAGSFSVNLDGTPVSSCTPSTPTGTSITFNCPVTGLSSSTHVISGQVSDTVGNVQTFNGSFSLDLNPPVIASVSPSGFVTTESPAIGATFSDVGSGINTASGVSVKLDTNPITNCTVTATSVSCPTSNVSEGVHNYSVTVLDNAGNSDSESGSFTVDSIAPQLSDIKPTGNVTSSSAAVYAYYKDDTSGVDTSSLAFYVDGAQVTTDCHVGESSATCTVYNLALGDHTVKVVVADHAGNVSTASQPFTYHDTAAPVISDIKPSGTVYTASTTVYAHLEDGGTGVNTSSVSVKMDGNQLSGCTVTSSSVSCAVSGYLSGTHNLDISAADLAGNVATASASFVASIDDLPPDVSNILPSGVIHDASATVYAYYSDSGSGVNSASVLVYMDGHPLNGCNITASSASCLVYGLTPGDHNIDVSVADNVGNVGQGSGSFTYMPGRDYYWTWYDNLNMNDWILMANPVGGSTLNFELSIANNSLSPGAITGMNPGDVPGGRQLIPRFGLMDGPVKVSSTTGEKAIVSQRILMGDSFEEVPGTDAENLSSHFYWTWYDQKTPGMTDWVLIDNTDAANDVYYQIKIAGKDLTAAQGSGVIKAGGKVTPTFPGVMGGPVEVLAWQVNKDGTPNTSAPAKVMASQRVVSNYGKAMNEVPGIPAEQLSSDYYWTWYDQQTPGAMDWVLVANPSASDDVYYQIRIAGQVKKSGSLKPSGDPNDADKVTPTFQGVMDGPVEVKSCSSAMDVYGDCSGTSPDIIASQRTIWGPSFEEVPGIPAAGSASQMSSDYHWSWYDQSTPGVSNWVLVANPSASDDVYYQITIAGKDPGPGSQGVIKPGKKVTPTFSGVMSGPVEVKAWHVNGNGTPDTSSPADILASQRVLWKGYFNELLGTVIK